MILITRIDSQINTELVFLSWFINMYIQPYLLSIFTWMFQIETHLISKENYPLCPQIFLFSFLTVDDTNIHPVNQARNLEIILANFLSKLFLRFSQLPSELFSSPSIYQIYLFVFFPKFKYLIMVHKAHPSVSCNAPSPHTSDSSVILIFSEFLECYKLYLGYLFPSVSLILPSCHVECNIRSWEEVFLCTTIL